MFLIKDWPFIDVKLKCKPCNSCFQAVFLLENNDWNLCDLWAALAQWHSRFCPKSRAVSDVSLQQWNILCIPNGPFMKQYNHGWILFFRPTSLLRTESHHLSPFNNLSGVPGSESWFYTWLLVPMNADPGKPAVMTQVMQLLPPTWKVWIESFCPGMNLRLGPLWVFGDWTSIWESLSHTPQLPFSLSLK